MNTGSEIVLMDKPRIRRSLNRMGHEIAEQNVNTLPVDLYGINDRGYAVAKALAEVLHPLINSEVRLFQLLMKNGDAKKIFNQISFEKDQAHFPLVVDDVIFSGSTMFKALKLITTNINISEIHTAALVDRGHRQFPIKAEFFGMELPTKINEHVSVLVENEQLQKVVLTKT